MIEGLWTSTFGTNIDAYSEGQTSVGSGVIVFNQGRILGGDVYYYYVGEYELIGDNKFTGMLHVERYIENTGIKDIGGSVFGPLNKFDLEFNGEINDGVIVAAGTLMQNRMYNFVARCIKRAELFETVNSNNIEEELKKG